MKRVILLGLVFLLCISLANAVTYEHGKTMAYVNIASGYEGVQNITANVTTTIYSVNKTNGDASAGVQVKYMNKSLMSNCTYTLTECVFTTPITLTAGQSYYFASYNYTTNWSSRSNSSWSSWPINMNSTLIMQQGGYWQTGTYTITLGNYIYSIIAFNTPAATTPTFALTLIDTYNSSTINVFTANFTNSSGTYSRHTTNGTIYFAYNNTANISIFNMSGTEGKYFNRTYNNQLTNASLQAEGILMLNKHLEFYNSLGVRISTLCYYDSIQYIGNELNLSTYNIGNATLNCPITSEYIEQDYLIINNSANQNITRTPISLILLFNEITNGTITTESTRVTYFHNNTLNVTQSTLPEGRITVAFGKLNGSAQRFEYLNDFDTYIEQNLTIIEEPNTPFFIQTQSSSGQGVDEAYISVYEFNYSIFTAFSSEEREIFKVGQYLSDNREPTLIWLDDTKRYYITIEKAGYDTRYEKFIDPKDISNTYADPKVYELKVQVSTKNSNYEIYTSPPLLYNLNSGQNVTLYLKLPNSATLSTANTIYLYTQYREDNAIANGLFLIDVDNETKYWKQMTMETLLGNPTRLFYTTLYDGVDYKWNGTNITVYMKLRYNKAWHDDDFIIYIADEEHDNIIIEPDSSWNYKTTGAIIFISLIVTIGFVRFFTQNQDYSFNLYLTGLAGITLLTGGFYTSTVMVLLYYGMLWLKKANGGE